MRHIFAVTGTRPEIIKAIPRYDTATEGFGSVDVYRAVWLAVSCLQHLMRGLLVVPLSGHGG
jgi:hypothetical protein